MIGKPYGGDHRASGYTPFWVDVDIDADDTSTSAGVAKVHELLIMADNRYNRTTAPTHTGGDFYEFGGLTRSVILHQIPAAAAAAPVPTRAGGIGANAATGVSAAAAATAAAFVPATPTTAFVKSIAVLTASAKLDAVNITAEIGGAFKGESVTVAFNGAATPSMTVPITGATVVITNVPVAAAVGGATPPKPWSSASPNLHTVTLTIKHSGGRKETDPPTKKKTHTKKKPKNNTESG